jgi:hypothetical protein
MKYFKGQNTMFFVHAIFLTVLLAMTGCDQSSSSSTPQPSSSTTGCGDKTALILIYDGFLQSPCGCAESSSQAYPSGTGISCTITAGVTVIFQIGEATLTHQIVSTDFNSGPVFDPQDATPIRSHAVLFNTAGTYSFFDQFNSGMTGTIVVQ